MLAFENQNIEFKQEYIIIKRYTIMKKIFPLFAVIIVLVLAVCSFHIIPTGYTGVKTSFGQIQETTIQSGKLNFCIPFLFDIGITPFFIEKLTSLISRAIQHNAERGTHVRIPEMVFIPCSDIVAVYSQCPELCSVVKIDLIYGRVIGTLPFIHCQPVA